MSFSNGAASKNSLVTSGLRLTSGAASRRRLTALAAAIAAGTLSVVGLVPAAAAQGVRAAPIVTDYTSKVDPFVATEGDYGNDMPGAQAPNGLAKVNPRTAPARNHTGYDYRESSISGFTHTNLDGVGGSGGGGDILVVPTSADYTSRPSTSSYNHAFSHADETASPGYYQVGLQNIVGTDTVSEGTGTINAEVAATTRTGVHRYAFPAGETPSLVIDLNTNNTSRVSSNLSVDTLGDGRAAISGQVVGHFYNASYTLYYYAETAQPVAGVQTWSDNGELTDATAQDGRDTGVVVTFDPEYADDIEFQVTLSPISPEQAKIDQQVEVGGLSFDQVRAKTNDEWNAKLGKVDVTSSLATDPTGETEQLFYTHLYRMFALPMNATSTSGTYRGVDGAVHRAQGFTYYDAWSTWDDFRKFSVLSYVDPQTYGDMAQSLVYLFADAEAEGSSRGLGSLMHSVPTIRWERSAVVVADAISKGYTGLDRLDQAYPGIERLVGGYSDADLDRGYIPDNPGAAVQLGYDQWALAVIADALGKDDEAEALRELASLPIDNLIKPDAWESGGGIKAGLLTPRNSNGDWVSADYERFEAARLYQGTLWQYHWYDAYDMDALIAAMGGEEAALLALEHMFGEDDPDNGSAMLHSNTNEIDLQAPYLFNYMGKPSLTQKWARAIYTKETWNRYLGTGSSSEVPSGGGEFTPPVKTKVYKLSPQGLLPTMDNDAGTMSTMYVSAALGLFPVTAGSAQFQIGSPFFDSATIHYDNGRTFTVNADNVSEDNFYIQSATMDGESFDNTWLDYSDVVSGGELSFQMGANPSDWGADTAPAYSMSTSSGEASDNFVVSANPSVIQAAGDGSVDGSIELTLHGGVKFAGAADADLTAGGAAQVNGLPAGVDAAVTLVNQTTAAVNLTGTASTDARFYVTFTDDAFAGGVRAANVDGQGVSSRAPLRLSVAAMARAALQDVVDDASLVRPGNYSLASYRAFERAFDKANELLDDADATSVDLRFGADSLLAAIDGLAIDGGGFRVLQGEASDAWSGGELKNESNSSSGNLGGVRTGSWIQYQGLHFIDADPNYLTIRYATSASSSDAPSTLTAHAGDKDGPVLATVDLEGTDGWGNYTEIVAEIADPQQLADAEKVTFVFTAPDSRSWVANFDWFQFSVDDPRDGGDVVSNDVVIEAEDWTANSGGGLKAESSNWSGVALTNLGGTANGDWLAYGDVDFGDKALGEVSVHYVNNSSRCGDDSAIDVYLDSFDSSNPGTPFMTIDLPATGSGWGDDATATVMLPDTVTGSHEVFLRLRTTEQSGRPYVANIDNLTFSPGGPSEVVVEAEHWTDNSGGALKSESSNWNDGAVTNLGGTHNGDWLAYGEIDFGSGWLDELAVHYVNNSGRCGDDSAIDVYLDSFDSDNPGTPFATIELPATGGGWNDAGTATLTLPDAVRGKHEVFLRLRTTEMPNRPYVANIDNLTFSNTDADDVEVVPVDTAALEAAIATYSPLEGQSDRFGSIDFRVFKRELDAARALVNSDSATQAQVDAQKDRLILAGEQLVPAERRLLENAIAAANGMSNDNFTDESWQHFTDALEEAQTVLDDNGATDGELLAARDALSASITALETNPATAPGVPDAPAVKVNGSSVTVTWLAPEDDGGADIEGYVVMLDDGHQVRIDDPAQTSAVFTWLKPGADYMARVMAINEAGTSEASDYSAAATPTKTGATGTPPAVSTPDDTNATLQSIQVAGVAIDGFAPEVGTYVVDWPESLDLPDVSATSTIDDAVVEITAGTPVMNVVTGGGGPMSTAVAVIGGAPQMTISVTSSDGSVTEQYTVEFYLTADNHLPAAVSDGGDGDDGGAGDGGNGDGGDGGNGDGTNADGGDDGSTDGGSASDDGSASDGTGTGQDGPLASTGAQGVAILALIGAMLLAFGLGLAEYRRRNGASTEVPGQTPLS